jgi:hypothetical protein
MWMHADVKSIVRSSLDCGVELAVGTTEKRTGKSGSKRRDSYGDGLEEIHRGAGQLQYQISRAQTRV